MKKKIENERDRETQIRNKTRQIIQLTLFVNFFFAYLFFWNLIKFLGVKIDALRKKIKS